MDTENGSLTLAVELTAALAVGLVVAVLYALELSAMLCLFVTFIEVDNSYFCCIEIYGI